MLNFLFRNLYRKTMLILISISTIPLILLGSFMFYYFSGAAERDYIENSHKYIKQVCKNIDDNLKNKEMLSIMTFTDSNVRKVLRMDGDKNDDVIGNYSIMGQFITNMINLSNDISEIYIFSDKHIYYQSMYDNSSVDDDYKYKEDKWYMDTIEKDGRINIIGSHIPFQSKMSNRYVLSLSRCIVDTTKNEVIGVVLIDINFESISDICDSNQKAEDSWIIITDGNGDIIYSPDRGQITQKIGIDKANFNQSDGYSFVNTNDTKVLMNYFTSEYSGWKFMQFTPESCIQKTRNVIGMVTIVSVVVLVIVVIMLAAFVSRSITIPIVRLNKVIYDIGKGDLQPKIDTRRKDEIGQLACGISKMANDLKDLIKRVTYTQLKQKVAELKSLQNQINPHFLYNTLGSIQMLAKINKQEEIAQMVDDLGMLFKISMSEGGDIVMLKKEFEHVELYIKLQKIRYGDKINCIIDVDEKIKDMYAIKLILQPIVENCIYHGLENKMTKGTIEINGSMIDNSIIITIKDDGVGINREHLESIRLALEGKIKIDTKMMNIGISNLNDRLKLYFGEEYGLTIDSEIGKGTRIKIILPIIKQIDDIFIYKSKLL